MQYVKKILVWAYGDTPKYVGFLASIFVVVAFLQVLIVYPFETLLTLFLGFIFYCLFIFWDEFN